MDKDPIIKDAEKLHYPSDEEVSVAENPEMDHTQGLNIPKNPKVEETAVSDQEDPYLRVYTLVGSQGSFNVDKSFSRDLTTSVVFDRKVPLIDKNKSQNQEKGRDPSTRDGLPSTKRGFDSVPTALVCDAAIQQNEWPQRQPL